MKTTFFHEKYHPHVPLAKILLMELREPLSNFYYKQMVPRFSMPVQDHDSSYKKCPDWLFNLVGWLQTTLGAIIHKLFPIKWETYGDENNGGYKVCKPDRITHLKNHSIIAFVDKCDGGYIYTPYIPSFTTKNTNSHQTRR